MKSVRTERIKVKQTVTLMQLAHRTKNLYNYGNYIIKFQLQHNKHFTSAYELMDIVRYHPAYTSLPGHTAQQTLKFLVKDWKGYFNALKVYKRTPEKFFDNRILQPINPNEDSTPSTLLLTRYGLKMERYTFLNA